MFTHPVMFGVGVAALLATSFVCAQPVPEFRKFVPHRVIDKQFSQQTALTSLVPEGWKIEEELYWDLSDPDVPLRYRGTCTDPAGPAAIQFFPDIVGHADIRGGKAPTSVIAGLETIIEKNRPGLRYRITDKKEKVVSDTSGMMSSNQPVATRISSGYVRIEYELGGKVVEEEFSGTLLVSQISTFSAVGRLDSWIWKGSEIRACRAAKGELDEVRRISQTIATSVNMPIEFYNLFSQVKGAVIQAGYDAIRHAAIRSRIIASAQKDISRTIMDSYWQNQRVKDRIHENFSDYMRGVEPYKLPEGGMVKLPSGYSNAWVNGRGEYIVSSKPLFDPNTAHLPGNWTPLSRGR
jgi:hypothetical protein